MMAEMTVAVRTMPDAAVYERPLRDEKRQQGRDRALIDVVEHVSDRKQRDAASVKSSFELQTETP